MDYGPTILAIATLVTSLTAAFISILAAVRSGNNGAAIGAMRHTVQTLETNTNSIKDALVKVTGEREFARGGKEERDRQTALEGAKAVATIAERDRLDAVPAASVGTLASLPPDLGVQPTNLIVKKK